MPVSIAPFASRHAEPIPHFLTSSSPAEPAPSHPLLDELGDVSKDLLNGLVRSALAGAGRYFTAKAEKAGDETRRRELLDALHVLRVSVAPIQRAFAVEVDRALTQSGPADDDVRVAEPCQALWLGLKQQLEHLSAKFAVHSVAGSFSPSRVLAALRNAVRRAELPDRTVAAIQELLEQGVMTHLDQVYRRMLERLELHSLPGAAPQFPVAANQAALPSASPSATLHVDPYTKSLLVEVSQTRDANSGPKDLYSNAQFATDLLDCIKADRGQDTMAVRTRAIIQRLALVGRLFGAIMSDPHLPQRFKQGIEGLRFPVIKSALADSSFFSNSAHSLRLLAAELVQKAVDLHLSGRGGEAPMRALLAHSAAHFDLSAAFVRPALAGLRPLPSLVVEKFLAELHDAGAERAKWVAEQASALVCRAIEPHLLDSAAALGAFPHLRESWIAVLTQRLLQQGHDTPAWREGFACFDEMLEHVSKQGTRDPLPDSLRQRLIAVLGEAGLSADAVLTPAHQLTPQAKADEIRTIVPSPHSEPTGPAVAPGNAPPVAPEETQPPLVAALQSLLRNGRWFRVFDHQHQKMRWLKVEAFYPEQNSIAFAEFDGANLVSVDATCFVEDLRRGRSAPTNPDSESRALLAEVQRLPSSAAG